MSTDAIKQKIETSTILSPQEKKEWLFLLPKMNAEQIDELDRILSVHMPARQSPDGSSRMAGEPERKWEVGSGKPENKGEIEKGLTSPALPSTPIVPSGLVSEGKKKIIIKPPVSLKPARENLIPKTIQREEAPVKTAPDPQVSSFSEVSLAEMRSAPSVYAFLEDLHGKIKNQTARGSAASDIWAAFERSPLYRVYLICGVKFMNGEKTADLSREEFEAIADFRSQLKREI